MIHSSPINEEPPPTSWEDCPEDSILSEEGTGCICRPEGCIEPLPCPENQWFSITNESTGLPGSCCPTYTCINCEDHEELHINEAGKCECKNPHMSFKNGHCECDQGRCELPYICNQTSVPVSVISPDHCCKNYECIPCPRDSFPYISNSEEIDDKCVCYPCNKPQCQEGQIPNIKRRGTNFPGKCCDLFECIDVNLTCIENGTVYSEGDTWTSDNKVCKCQKGISLCSKNESTTDFRSCRLSGGVVYQHLDKWVLDICTNCTCIDGTPKCIAHMCDVKETEIKLPECPTLDGCDSVCDYGYKIKNGCRLCDCEQPDVTVKINATKIPKEVEIILTEIKDTSDKKVLEESNVTTTNVEGKLNQ